MKCPSCNAELDKNASFCEYCGAKIKSEENFFCQKCGTKLNDGAKFCTKCAAPVPQSGFTVSQPESKVISGEYDTRASVPNRSGNRRTGNKQKKPKAANNWIIAAIAILCLVVFFISIGSGGNKPKKSNPDNLLSQDAASDKKTVAMPSLLNKTYSEAFGILKDSGFSDIKTNVPSDGNGDLWIVVNQSIPDKELVSPDTQIEILCERKYKLYLDISSEFNLLFSRYDFTVSLDGEEIGSVSNGSDFTYLAEVLSGTHEIIFCKSGSTSPQSTKKLAITNNTTYSCDIAHSSNSLDIKNEKTERRIVGVTDFVVPDVKEMILSEAMNKLEAVGFSNLRGEPFDSITDTSDWIVLSQSIQVDTIAAQEELFSLGCTNLTDYIKDTYLNKNANEVLEFAYASGYSLRFEDESAAEITSSFASMDSNTRRQWIITEAKPYDGTIKTMLLIAKFVKDESQEHEPENGNQGTADPSEAEPLEQNPDTEPQPDDENENNTPEKNESADSGEESQPEDHEYDIDLNLVVTKCLKKTESGKKVSYQIAFEQRDDAGKVLRYLSFKGKITDLSVLGENFADGIPSWFTEGRTVHVKAYLDGSSLSAEGCIITEGPPIPAKQPSNTAEKEEQSQSKDTKKKTISYSSNDLETAKKGNSGVFSYSKSFQDYLTYYIIDFDEGYVYTFEKREYPTSCERLKIIEGDLNEGVTIKYHDGDTSWYNYLHFKYKRIPDKLVVVDGNGYSVEYTTTDLKKALKLKDAKTIVDY